MKHSLIRLTAPLPLLLTHRLDRERTQLSHWEQAIRLSHPDNILRRGFSIVSSHGAILTSSSSISVGQALELRFHDGVVHTLAQAIQSEAYSRLGRVHEAGVADPETVEQ